MGMAQNQQLEEKVTALKQSQADNKLKLARYTWQETETIAIGGDVKDTKTWQVQMVNGQPQKTLINDEMQNVRVASYLNDPKEPLTSPPSSPSCPTALTNKESNLERAGIALF